MFGIALLALFAMLFGCAGQPAQAPADTGSSAPLYGNNEPATPDTDTAVPNVPSSEGMPSVPEGAPQAENTPPSNEPPSDNGGPQPAPANDSGPDRLGVMVPEDPKAGTATFIVEIPANTAAGAVINLERYYPETGTWGTPIVMEFNSLLEGYSATIDVSPTSQSEDGVRFLYRYSRDGRGYETAEQFAFDTPNAYRARAIADIEGGFVNDFVTKWRDGN